MDAPKTKREAKSDGVRWYNTGVPCKRGHLSNRSVATGQCLGCVALRNAQPKTKELVKAASAAYYAREDVKARKRSYSLNRYHSIPGVKEKNRSSDKRRSASEKRKRWRSEFAKTPKQREKQKRFRSSEKRREWLRDNFQKRKQDHNFRLKYILRNRLAMALKRGTKTGSAIRDLGCSVEYLRKHLERQFKVGMSWENFGKGARMWNIDHVIPLSSFDLSDLEQVKVAVNYKNLQPLWQSDNSRKGAKHPTEFAQSQGQLL